MYGEIERGYKVCWAEELEVLSLSAAIEEATLSASKEEVGEEDEIASEVSGAVEETSADDEGTEE